MALIRHLESGQRLQRSSQGRGWNDPL